MSAEPPRIPDDPLSRYFRERVDMTLLRKNLTLTVEQRLDQLMELQRFAEEVRAAGHVLCGDETRPELERLLKSR